MGFDVADALRSHPCGIECSSDGRRLPGHRGRGVGGFLGTVVGDGRAFDDGVDAVARSHGIVHALEHQAGNTGSQHHAAGLGVKGPEHAVLRQGATIKRQIACGGYGDAGTTGECGVALAIAQALCCQMQGHAGGRASGLHAERRAAQVQLEGDAGGGVVLVVTEDGVEVQGVFAQLRMACEVAHEVTIAGDTGKHADALVATV